MWTLVTDLSTGTDRPLVTDMRRLSIITGAGRVLVMGAYTGPDGSVERRTCVLAPSECSIWFLCRFEFRFCACVLSWVEILWNIIICQDT